MKPAPMTDEQKLQIAGGNFWGCDTTFTDIIRTVEDAMEARDAQWEQMLASQLQEKEIPSGGHNDV